MSERVEGAGACGAVEHASLATLGVGILFATVLTALNSLSRVEQRIRAEVVDAILENIAHEDWCCAMGCTHMHGSECPGCTCLRSTVQRAADQVCRPQPTAAPSAAGGADGGAGRG